jgi:hypothetical protein
VPRSVAIDEEITRADAITTATSLDIRHYAPGVTALSTTEKAARLAGATALGANRVAIWVAVHSSTAQFMGVRARDLICGANANEPRRTGPAQALTVRIWVSPHSVDTSP